MNHCHCKTGQRGRRQAFIHWWTNKNRWHVRVSPCICTYKYMIFCGVEWTQLWLKFIKNATWWLILLCWNSNEFQVSWAFISQQKMKTQPEIPFSIFCWHKRFATHLEKLTQIAAAVKMAAQQQTCQGATMKADDLIINLHFIRWGLNTW